MHDPAATGTMALSEGLGLKADAFGTALFALADEIKAGLSIKDAITGRYLHANQAMAACFRLAPGSLVGRIDAELLDPDVWGPLLAAEQLAATQSSPQTRLHRVELAGQACEFLVMRMVLGSVDAGAPRLLLGVWIDQTAQHHVARSLQQALAQLERRVQPTADATSAAGSVHDPRDALPAQDQFDEQLRRELDLSNREHREFALVAVALDPFAPELQLHGELGHQRVQEAVTRLLRSNTRAMDATFRLDRERFVILLSGVGLATAHARIEGLRRQCATEIIAIDGQGLRFTVSMGVASYPHTTQDRDGLLAAADAARALAQQRGGNHVALAGIRFERR